jgi:hypothetical protein
MALTSPFEIPESNSASGRSEEPAFSLVQSTLGDVRDSSKRYAVASLDSPTGVKVDGGEGDNPRPAEGSVQEFVNGFGHLGTLYSDAVHNDKRSATFQERMENVFTGDPQTFRDMASIGDRLVAKPPASPAEVGKSLADAYASALDREGKKTGNLNLGSPDMVNLMAATSGVMIGARSTFDQAKMPEQTKAMVDAMEGELAKKGVQGVHAVIWDNSNEPGVAFIPPGMKFDRYHCKI